MIVRRYREGDASALADLIRRFHPRVYAVCARMLGDGPEAADVTQDALIRVIEGIDSFDGRSALSTWIIRVTMNCCISHLRREKLRRHAPLDVPLPSEALRREPAAAERVELAEQADLAMSALAGLEPDARAMLVLRDLQGLEYEQISQVLGIPIGTVKSRLFRARSALRALLRREEDERPPARAPASRMDGAGDLKRHD